MTNVVSIAKPVHELETLAQDINSMIADVTDLRLALAIKFARARELCRADGISFKSWCETHVKHTWVEAARLAQIGAAPDPAKAIEDLRAKARERTARHRALLTRAPETPPPVWTDGDRTVISVTPSDEEDVENGARIRGFLARAEDAASFALDDNMQGVEISEQMVAAAREAARAWSNLAETLEAQRESR